MIQQQRTIEALAQTHGLRRASEIEPSPKRAEVQAIKLEYVDETPPRPRRTELERRVEEDLAHYWVTVLAYDRAMPLHMGANQSGMLPVWIETNGDWRDSGANADRYTPAARIIRLIVIGVPSAEHGLRLKAALDEALKGKETEDDAAELRNRFRNAIDFGDVEHWLTPLVQDAIIICELQAAHFEVFSREDHNQMVRDRKTRIAGELVGAARSRRG